MPAKCKNINTSMTKSTDGKPSYSKLKVESNKMIKPSENTEKMSQSRTEGRHKKESKRKLQMETDEANCSFKKVRSEQDPSPQFFSPRRSSRGVVPNRKYQDMEVEITPSRRKSLKNTGRNDVKEKSEDLKKGQTKNVKEHTDVKIPEKNLNSATGEQIENEQEKHGSVENEKNSEDVGAIMHNTIGQENADKSSGSEASDQEDVVRNISSSEKQLADGRAIEKISEMPCDEKPETTNPEQYKLEMRTLASQEIESKINENTNCSYVEDMNSEYCAKINDEIALVDNNASEALTPEADANTCMKSVAEMATGDTITQEEKMQGDITLENDNSVDGEQQQITFITKEVESEIESSVGKTAGNEEAQDSVLLKVKCLNVSEPSTTGNMEIELVALNESDIQEISSKEISHMLEEQVKNHQNNSTDIRSSLKDGSNEIRVEIFNRKNETDSKVITIKDDDKGRSYCLPIISSRVADLPGKPKPSTSEKNVIQNITFSNKSTETDIATVHDGGTGSKHCQEYVIVTLPDDLKVTRKTIDKWTGIPRIPFEQKEDGEFVCGLCDYKTYKKTNWYKHKKTHLPKKEYACPKCTYIARTSSNLKRHLAIHDDIRQYQCHVCHLMFRQKIHLMRHIKYRHEEKKVECSLCDYVCANENPDLKVHMLRKHCPPGSTEIGAGFSCEECGVVSMSKKDLKQHMKFHKKGPELKLFCEHCSFVTDCESRLKRHMLTHSNEKPYMCGNCDYRATQKEHILRHLRTQHNMVVRACNKATVKNTDENSNTESTDSKEDKADKTDFSSMEKIFACNHCPMKFAKLLNLYKHLHAQHKSVLPMQSSDEYLCVVCDFRTSSRKNLLVHMRKHNIHDHSPPSHVYSCVLCRYMNPRRKNLFQHMKKKHNIEIILKEDGTSSCFVMEGNGSEFADVMSSMMNKDKGNVDDTQLHIITADDLIPKGGIQIQNMISMEELASAISNPQPVLHSWKKKVETTEEGSANTSVDIEGLKTLAEQAERNSSLLKNIDSSQEGVDEMETEIITMDTTTTDVIEATAEKSSIQLTAEDIMDLSSGDYVQIDGEMYKIEFSGEQKNNLPGRIESAQAPDDDSIDKDGQMITIEPYKNEADFPMEIAENDVNLTSKEGEEGRNAKMAVNNIISHSKGRVKNFTDLHPLGSAGIINSKLAISGNADSSDVIQSHSIPGVNDVEISNESQIIVSVKQDHVAHEPAITSEVIQQVTSTSVESSFSQPYIVLEPNTIQTVDLESVSEHISQTDVEENFEYQVLQPGPDGKINISNSGTNEFILVDVSSSETAL